MRTLHDKFLLLGAIAFRLAVSLGPTEGLGTATLPSARVSGVDAAWTPTTTAESRTRKALIVLGDDLAGGLGAQVAQGEQADLVADELDGAVGEGQVGPARVLAAVDAGALVVQVGPRRVAPSRRAGVEGGGQLP